MAQDKDIQTTRDDHPPKNEGILPDGVRGTTRDTGHTVPADEHAGYRDPTKPELRKPSSEL
ncbi:hypothetical protein RAH32_08980 [Paracoccus sp. WLY502]|uniref:hypothetical protein n=1 Tax=Paracoccus yibinensis TaxID=3068891 RepID=UPI002796D21F|nr:hypothetical protein [Paracoccus sp. WLY502]MDQ1900577.1 hypothetical protein [Paracoccus sp. WLY502]